jgi:hypothetical protein
VGMGAARALGGGHRQKWWHLLQGSALPQRHAPLCHAILSTPGRAACGRGRAAAVGPPGDGRPGP